MARPKSLFERFTQSSLPLPELRERLHIIERGESLLSIANLEYELVEYDPNLWRDLGLQNGIENPFTFAGEFLGRGLKVPSIPLPDFA